MNHPKHQKPEPRLEPKHLAFELGHSRGYIYAMVSLGFPMPDGRATVTEAKIWLEAHPRPYYQMFKTRGYLKAYKTRIALRRACQSVPVAS